MKIVSWNVNGIRAVERKKNLQEFIANTPFDICFLQEIKGNQEQFSKFLTAHEDFQQFYFSAEKKGYAGTGVWIKKSFLRENVIASSLQYLTGMDSFIDTEGRISQLQFQTKNGQKYALLGVYFPNGGKSPTAWQEKLVFYDRFLEYVNSLQKQGFIVVWCGDVNCAHEEVDLARPETNRNSIGFLPEERAWISNCLENSWVDVFRQKYPQKVQYSWWHLLTRARARNVGWRIDYFFVHQSHWNLVQDITYLDQQMGSDHCPVLLDLSLL
ncbi:exodeoxyribonuclease III [bacterium DOLZORAL124_38_8]|nr:MAG: exodeoxyribonuclease III [bacterium DOLZORAL124_38_8]